MSGPYDDIIHLPHPVSHRHARMSLQDRAAQFSPFAALTGYDAAIDETARLTNQRIELGPDARLELNEALSDLRSQLDASPKAAITHFVPDPWKEGGCYVTTPCQVVKIDIPHQWLLTETGQKIPFDDILTIHLLP